MDDIKGRGNVHAHSIHAPGSAKRTDQVQFDLEELLHTEFSKGSPLSDEKQLEMHTSFPKIGASDILFADKAAAAGIPTIGARIVNGLKKGARASAAFMEVAVDVLVHAGLHSSPEAFAGSFLRDAARSATSRPDGDASSARRDKSEQELLAELERELLEPPRSAGDNRKDSSATVENKSEREPWAELERELMGASERAGDNRKDSATLASSGTSPRRQVRRGGGMSLG